MILQHWVKWGSSEVGFGGAPGGFSPAQLVGGRGGGDSSERDSVRSPFAWDGNATLVPRHVADMGVSTYLAKVDRLLSEGSVETFNRQSHISVRFNHS